MTDLGTYPSSSYILGPDPKADPQPDPIVPMSYWKCQNSSPGRVCQSFCLHLTGLPENSTLAEDTRSAPLGPSFLQQKREVTSYFEDIKKSDRTRHVAGL